MDYSQGILEKRKGTKECKARNETKSQNISRRLRGGPRAPLEM